MPILSIYMHSGRDYITPPHPLSGNASLNSDPIPVGFPRGKASPSVTLVGHQKLSSVFNDF